MIGRTPWALAVLTRIAVLIAVLTVSAAPLATIPAALAATERPDAGSEAPGRGAIVKGPYVTSVSDTTATVRFELASPGPATVEMLGGSAPMRFESRDADAMHVVATAGLMPSTRYAYTVRAGHGALATGHLTTAPASDADAPCTFIVYGDDRTDDDAHAAVVRAMSAVPSDFLINTGDMVADGGSAANWATFFDIERDLLRERPLFAAIGNHELYDDAAGANFSRYFGFADASGAARPYGTVRFGAVRFFMLNGMHDWEAGPERAWLDQALASADAEPGVAWRFAIVHHGPWSAGPHGPNTKLLEAGVPALLSAHKVELLFSGHDHIYERGDAGLLKYIVSGGGGAPLYRDLHLTATTRKVEAAHHFVEVSTHGDALQIVARRIDGSVLDRCGFIKGGAWDCDPSSTSHASGSGGLPAKDPIDAGGAMADGAVPGTPPPPSPRSSACQCAAPGASAARGGLPLGLLLGLLGVARRRR